TYVKDMEPQPECNRCDLQLVYLGVGQRRARVREYPDYEGRSNELMKQLQLLRRELSCVKGRPSDISAWPVELGDEANLHRLARGCEDDWNCIGCRLGGQRRGGGTCVNDRDLAANQIGRQGREPIILVFCPAVFDPNIAVLNIARVVQALPKRYQ